MGFEQTFIAKSLKRPLSLLIATTLLGFSLVAGGFSLVLGPAWRRDRVVPGDADLDAEIRAEIAALEEQRRRDGTADRFLTQAELDTIGDQAMATVHSVALGLGGTSGLLFLGAVGVWQLGRRWRPVPIRVTLHEVRWGAHRLLFEDLTGVQREGPVLIVHRRDDVPVTNGSMSIQGVVELESMIRQGIQLAQRGTDRTLERQQLGALLTGQTRP